MNVSLPHPKYSNLSLSPVVIDDASEMVISLNDEQTLKYLIDIPYPVSIEQVQRYIFSRPSVSGHCLTWAIRHNGSMIGEVSLEPAKTPRRYELGYYLARPYWNNGIASVAVKTYLDVMIKQISDGEDIIIEAEYIVDNLASEKILGKCGFKEVGHKERTKNRETFQIINMVRIIPGKWPIIDLANSYN